MVHLMSGVRKMNRVQDLAQTVHLGPNGILCMQLSQDLRSICLDLEVREEGLTKSEINAFIYALCRVREGMMR